MAATILGNFTGRGVLCLMLLLAPQQKQPETKPAGEHPAEAKGTKTVTKAPAVTGVDSAKLINYMIWMAAFAGFLVVVAMILLYIRSVLQKRQAEEATVDPLSTYREMYDEGELSTDEFQTIKSLVRTKKDRPLPTAAELKQMTQASASPKPDHPDADLKTHGEANDVSQSEFSAPPESLSGTGE